MGSKSEKIYDLIRSYQKFTDFRNLHPRRCTGVPHFCNEHSLIDWRGRSGFTDQNVFIVNVDSTLKV